MSTIILRVTRRPLTKLMKLFLATIFGEEFKIEEEDDIRGDVAKRIRTALEDDEPKVVAIELGLPELLLKTALDQLGDIKVPIIRPLIDGDRFVQYEVYRDGAWVKLEKEEEARPAVRNGTKSQAEPRAQSGRRKPASPRVQRHRKTNGGHR